MRVALIYFRENYTPTPPMGILYIGTVLQKAGYDVKVYDSFPDFYESTIREVKQFAPMLIGVSVLTTGHSLSARYTDILRIQNPAAVIGWGGVHAAALPHQVLSTQKVDFVVTGEGELVMLRVCECLKNGQSLHNIAGIVLKENGKIYDYGRCAYIEDLDQIPIPDRNLLKCPPFVWYLSPPGILRGRFHFGIATMYASRGCPYQCIFCASKVIHGSRLRRRSVGNVLQEMQYLKQDFGATGVYFNDDTFATDVGWLEDFCDALKNSQLNMIWGCQTRADIAARIDVLMMMKQSGCVQVDIGCESGSDKILQNLKKGITASMIRQSFENLRKVKMTTFATFILGNPEETAEDVYQTEMLAKLAPGGVSFLTLVPYPGSPLYQMAIDNKWLVTDGICFDENWTNKQSDAPVMQASFSIAELVRMRAVLQNKFFWRNTIPTVICFLKNPRYLFKLLKVVVMNPCFVIKAARKAFQKRKIMDFLEDIYQRFNEDLRASFGRQ